ncbi:MAG: hypothetical protein ACKVOW_12685 [Chitinophagaceae bacterium]
MKNILKANGFNNEIFITKSFLAQNGEVFTGSKLTVQQALCKWYTLLNMQQVSLTTSNNLFHNLPEKDIINSLKKDIEITPALLMEEFISSLLIIDKGQYIKLVQALLVNISDELLLKKESYPDVCKQIETVLNFIQNFFYQYIDMDSKLTKFRSKEFIDCSKLKLQYLQIKLNHSNLIEIFEECLYDNPDSAEHFISFRQLNYMQNLLQQIETVSTVITENYVRELFIYNNFNSSWFIGYEIKFMKNELSKIHLFADKIIFLQNEYARIDELKHKPGKFYNSQEPSIKKQLANWITEEIKQTEIKNRKVNDKDLVIDTDSKIQTSLSVAKLAVLMRLLVVDKIIINRTVAPMLKTVSKLFTTLQKDEISFGSLETKYHAPDKTTLNTMKEMLGKWTLILGKL